MGEFVLTRKIVLAKVIKLSDYIQEVKSEVHFSKV